MKKDQTRFNIKVDTLEETDSTNNYIRNTPIPDDMDGLVVATEYQTAGKGQGTNHWESERGKNLLFSFKCRPYGIKASEQFLLMQAVSVGLWYALVKNSIDCCIKWPNDIYTYYGDKKISGTLSECTIRNGMVYEFIAGIGINVNQTIFTSDAPNPISMANILGKELDRDKLLKEIIENIVRLISILNNGDYETIRLEYFNKLYRIEDIYTYEDKDGRFEAEFENVLPNGHLVLRRTDGTLSEYEFKEVRYII